MKKLNYYYDKYVNLETLSILIIIGAILFALQVIYWLIVPVDVIRFVNRPVPVDQEQYVIGEKVGFEIEFCKLQSLPAKTYYIFQGQGISYQTEAKIITDYPDGCYDLNWVKIATIPEEAAPGTYHLEIVADYRVNPVRIHQEVIKSVEFEVKSAQ